jgi:hypothetical protein
MNMRTLLRNIVLPEIKKAMTCQSTDSLREICFLDPIANIPGADANLKSLKASAHHYMLRK